MKKTARLLSVHEAVKTLGIGAEISAMIAEALQIFRACIEKPLSMLV